jgi:two-component system cell cycle response regulator DivK
MSPTSNPRGPLDVLIAEDDCDVRLAVRQLLEGEGYTCAEAEDGRAAVEAARHQAPRLVLMDLMMPEVDGFAATQQIRADPLTRDIRIHCLTALNYPGARQAAQEAGCDGFLAKPFSPDDLLSAVRAAVNSGRAGDDALTQAIEGLGKTLAARVPGRERAWSEQLDGTLAELEQALREPAEQLELGLEMRPGVDLGRPTLFRRALALRQQCQRLGEQARALRGEVQGVAQIFQAPPIAGGLPQVSGAGAVVDFSAIRRSGARLLEALKRHAAAERELLFESVNTDIGVGD